MRGSPISNLRQNRQEYSTSPYESNPRNQSPRTNQNSPSRNPYASDNDYWRVRARQLQAELLGVNEELVFQIRKNEKIEDLEEKIELLLAQNTHFVDENQNLIRLVQQKNGEIENWRRKFDNEYAHSSIAQAEKKKVFDHLNLKDQEHQIQVEKLLSEITRLQNEASEADNLRKLELHRLRNQYENQAISQIQNLRRSQNGNNEIQELNIRKLKDQLEEKNFQIQNLSRQIKLKNEELKAEISFNRNEFRKLEEQKTHEIDLIKAEHENAKSNLVRAHKKNEEEIKNLNENKVKRLVYEIEEKKHEIEEVSHRLRRTGKENESELNRIVNDNANVRNETKENDNRHRERIQELTSYFENQLTQDRNAAQGREDNLKHFYDNQIDILNRVIEAKDEQIKRLLNINKELKVNEDRRLTLIQQNNDELKRKIEEIVKHYEREVELMKIKISQLYEADLQALRNRLRDSYANHNLENETLRNLLRETQQRLANEVQNRLDQRKDYELRLTEIGVSHDKNEKELKSIISHREKELEGHTSKASLTHIEHNSLLQKGNITVKQLMNDKRVLEGQLLNKNKEIETLNLKIQTMLSYHKRDTGKLEADLQHAKDLHDKWLQRQSQETNEWIAERNDLNQRNDDLSKRLQDNKRKNQERETDLSNKLSEKNLEIANLKGLIQQFESKVGSLHSKNKVQVQNVEKTVLETRSLMNNEKEKFLEAANREKKLIQAQNERIRNQLQRQIDDLKYENDLLEDNYRKAKIREEELVNDIRGLTDSVNKRSKLEESVINIGLSNNYFKNVAEIFKRPIDV